MNLILLKNSQVKSLQLNTMMVKILKTEKIYLKIGFIPISILSDHTNLEFQDAHYLKIHLLHYQLALEKHL